AETVDQAIALGLEELKVAEEDIKIDVLEGGSKGFLGLGKKDAEVQLTVINPELKTYETIDALINRGQPGEETSMVDEVLEERNAEEETRQETEGTDHTETIDETKPQEEVTAAETTVAAAEPAEDKDEESEAQDRKSTRLNSSHVSISY